MGDTVNLRLARKRIQRQREADSAAARRAVHGLPKHQRSLARAQQEKAQRELENHRIGTGGGK